MHQRIIRIGNREVGAGKPAYIIAEISANHNQSFEAAKELIHAAHKAGADAVKLQTYRPDTITIDCDNQYFRIKGTIWNGKNLYDLYAEAYTPWEWHPELKRLAETLGMQCFSSPFDSTAVDFLEELDVPAYKIASFENVDIPLLQRVSATGKPIIMSTGMASFEEIEEAVSTLRASGTSEVALLKCTSGYPAELSDMNLQTIAALVEAFNVPVGLSDHTLGEVVPVAAIAVGASIIEKHITLSRAEAGPDSAFSLEPQEFASMVTAVRAAQTAIGTVFYGITPGEEKSRALRRSLFVVENVKAGETLSLENVRSIRPADGLHTRYLNSILGKKAVRDIPRGTPLAWDLVE